MSSLNDIVREAIDDDLNANEVLELFENKLGFLLYEKLYNFETLPEVLGDKDGVVILYQFTKYQGHFCLLTKRGDEYEWFDSLGYKPDYELKYFPYDKDPQLSNLIRRYVNNGGKVIINNYKFQRDTDSISTCDRWFVDMHSKN